MKRKTKSSHKAAARGRVVEDFFSSNRKEGSMLVKKSQVSKASKTAQKAEKKWVFSDLRRRGLTNAQLNTIRRYENFNY